MSGAVEVEQRGGVVGVVKDVRGGLVQRPILTRRLGKTLSLSGSQLSEINWTDDDGEEPVGG